MSGDVPPDGIEVFRVKSSHGIVDPYPWRFAVTHNGTRHEFAGLPNKCETPGKAYRRALQRFKWMEDGSYSRRYK